MKKITTVLFALCIVGTTNAQVTHEIFLKPHYYKSNYPAYVIPYVEQLHGTIVEITEDVYTADAVNGQPANKRKGTMDRKVISLMDEQRRMLLETTYNEQNKLLQTITYTYKENLLQKISKIAIGYDTLGNPTSTDSTNTFFYYNDKKEMIQETQFTKSSVNNDGWTNPYSNYNSYTPEGKLAYTNENTYGQVTVYSYDERGNCITVSVYELDGERVERKMPAMYQLVVEYNTLNQRTLEDHRYANNIKIQRHLSWNDKGLLTKLVTLEKQYDTSTDTTTFQLHYNEQGNKIKCEYLTKDAHEYDNSTYEYDDHNNWTTCAIKVNEYYMIIERTIKYK